MATAEFKATIGNVTATASPANGVGATSSDASAADTAVGTVVTDLTTAFTAYDAAAASIIAITGDTYSNTTHQFTTGGATGLTHAQWATQAALLNTAATNFKTAQTDTTTAKTATALVVTDAAAIDSGADVTVRIGSVANVSDLNKLKNALNAIFRLISGSDLLAVGSGTPRSP